MIRSLRSKNQNLNNGHRSITSSSKTAKKSAFKILDSIQAMNISHVKLKSKTPLILKTVAITFDCGKKSFSLCLRSPDHFCSKCMT